ncbi:hypothetical protein [Pontibacillus litoralis]|uniref:DUF4064 domain-containing protein n=1 Tax=Pontibacillus litoralis JSM 072002 TaxID=1385512 RepID=A0A0A5FZV3_9BACI|nr:hypothetical protein [Pontibacillus litoralis]KGX84363.1 hypothetical protein N784_13585 [Pontibacillus litoralis JSM 072002]
MRTTIIIGGLLGILISLTVMLSAIVDDSYTLGNFGILAIVGSVLAITGSFRLYNKGKLSGYFIITGCLLGIYGLWYFYTIPALLITIPYLFILLKKVKTH